MIPVISTVQQRLKQLFKLVFGGKKSSITYVVSEKNATNRQRVDFTCVAYIQFQGHKYLIGSISADTYGAETYLLSLRVPEKAPTPLLIESNLLARLRRYVKSTSELHDRILVSATEKTQKAQCKRLGFKEISQSQWRLDV